MCACSFSGVRRETVRAAPLAPLRESSHSQNVPDAVHEPKVRLMRGTKQSLSCTAACMPNSSGHAISLLLATLRALTVDFELFGSII